MLREIFCVRFIVSKFSVDSVNLNVFKMVYKSLMTLDDPFRSAPHLAPLHLYDFPLPVYPVVSAHGCELFLAGGEQLVDGMSSWWAAIHGYNHPRLNAALKGQIDQMSHVMFGGITHPPAVALCRQLVAMTPGPRWSAFSSPTPVQWR